MMIGVLRMKYLSRVDLLFDVVKCLLLLGWADEFTTFWHQILKWLGQSHKVRENLLRLLTNPRKLANCFLSAGGCMCTMAFTFFGSGFTMSFDITWPKKGILDALTTSFSGLNLQFISLAWWSSFVEGNVVGCPIFLEAIDDCVIRNEEDIFLDFQCFQAWHAGIHLKHFSHPFKTC